MTYIQNRNVFSPSAVTKDIKDHKAECPAVTVPSLTSSSQSSNCSEITMHIDSDEDHAIHEAAAINYNYFTAPDTSDIDTEIEEEEAKSLDVTMISHPKDDENDLSYDQITKMLGADMTSTDFLDNLYQEEKANNASSWFSLSKYTKSKKKMRNHQIECIRTSSTNFGLLSSTSYQHNVYHLFPISVDDLLATVMHRKR